MFAGYPEAKDSITASDYNLWNEISYIKSNDTAFCGGSYTGPGCSSGFCTYDGWKNLGYDVHSTTGDPKLSGTYFPGLDSSAIGLGENLTNLGITALNSDKAGNPRPSTGPWDIGAYEYVPGGDTTAPAAPTGLTVQ
jgi:hypothetical protein